MRTRFLPAAFLLAAGLWIHGGCARGPRVAFSPDMQKFYETARLIMSREESRIFRLLPDEASRTEFVDDFWAKRDPNPDTEINEFRVEFQKRVDYVTRRFQGEGLRGWDTDRGRIYIFMGPPDKFEEDFSHGDTTVSGSIIWWIYYKYGLGIEFVDAKGNGSYNIRRYEGEFLDAIDVLKLGAYVGTEDAFLKKAFAFDLVYDRASGDVEIALPAKFINFKELDDGRFSVDLKFKFYIYSGRDLAKTGREEDRSYSGTNTEISDLARLRFRFQLPLGPGRNYVDVIIQGRTAGSGRVRRLFEVRGRS
jgi:GWxTD domain-containing protein